MPSFRNTDGLRYYLANTGKKRMTQAEMAKWWKALSIKDRTAYILTGEPKK